MSRRTTSGWITAATLFALAGCAGPRAPLADDPLRGGKPIPTAATASNPKPDNDEPIPLPPAVITATFIICPFRAAAAP